MTYIIVLNVTKFGDDQWNSFWDVKQKPWRGGGWGGGGREK